MSRQWAALPDGELHPQDRCSFCGHRYRLIRVVIASTNAIGYRCSDPVECIRRRRRGRIG